MFWQFRNIFLVTGLVTCWHHISKTKKKNYQNSVVFRFPVWQSVRTRQAFLDRKRLLAFFLIVLMKSTKCHDEVILSAIKWSWNWVIVKFLINRIMNILDRPCFCHLLSLCGYSSEDIEIVLSNVVLCYLMDYNHVSINL